MFIVTELDINLPFLRNPENLMFSTRKFLALQNNLCLFALFFLFYYQQNTRYFDLFCFFLLAHFEQFCPTFVKLTLKSQINFKICISCSWPKAQRKPMQNHFSSHCSNILNFADKTEWSEFFSEDKVLYIIM